MQHFSSLTTDNASVNNVLIQTAGQCLLNRYNIPWMPDMHIRCIAHIVNLVVQAILHSIDEADDPSTMDYFDLHKDQPIHCDPANSSDQKEMEEEIGEDETEDLTDEDISMEEEFVGVSALRQVSLHSLDML